jgi:putative polyketide hydroxylase
MQTGIDLDTYQVGGENNLTDPTEKFAGMYGIESTGAVMVRPDGFVGWRAKTAEGAFAQQVTRALSSLLSLDSRAQCA